MYWKTSKTLGFIVLNRLISLLLDEVLMSREKKDGRHLLESTMENPQPENATCPSSKCWPIQCPCIEAHKAAKMDLVDGINIVFAPPMAIDNWCKEIKKFINLK